MCIDNAHGEQDSENESSGTGDTVVIGASLMRKRVHKTPDDSIPLPQPFKLPKHYRKDIEIALRTQKMTKETRSAFLSAVASSMLT